MTRNPVSKFMVQNPIKVDLHASVFEVAKLMLENSISSVIIVDDSTVLGIVTERDLVHRVLAVGLDPSSTTAFEACSKPVISIFIYEEVDDAIELMKKHSVRRLVVVDQYGKVVGILTSDDVGYHLKNVSEKLAIKYLRLMSGKRHR